VDAFDADVLIYAASPGHTLGRRVLGLLRDGGGDPATRTGIGSVLLLPELLSKPTRDGAEQELIALAAVLARLNLLPVDDATARLAVGLGSLYRLRSADAVHLATAVGAGADRFITNNQRDFPKAIAEVDIVYPIELPEPRS